MNKLSITKNHALLPIALLLFASASTVYADDGKVYPGIMCQGSLVGSPSVISYTGTSVRNNSTTNSAVISCPIVKDSVFSFIGANEAYLRYCKGPAGFNSSLYSYSPYGTSSYVNSKWDFSGAGCNKTISHDPILSYSQGYYVMVVTMPPSSVGAGAKTELFSYRLDEN